MVAPADESAEPLSADCAVRLDGLGSKSFLNAHIPSVASLMNLTVPYMCHHLLNRQPHARGLSSFACIVRHTLNPILLSP